MDSKKYTVLLADDDLDDCLFFEEAMAEMSNPPNLTTVGDGVKLLAYLNSNLNQLPDIVFIDMNMPKKSGIECVVEIKANEKLKHLPLIIYSTSLDPAVINILHKNGALYYMQKQGDFSIHKRTIQKALALFSQNGNKLQALENFIITL